MTSNPAPLFRVRPSIVLFGDSITQFAFGVPESPQGWATHLSASYSRRADIFSRGFSGYNTDMAVDLLQRVFTGPFPPVTPDRAEQIQSDVLFCTVFFGANDAALPGGKQHVPKERYAKNLETIVNHIRSSLNSKDLPVILITPPPFDAPAWMKFLQVTEPGRSNDVAKEYGDEVKKVAQKMNCEVVDTWELLEGNSANKSKHLSDGLHLNDSGNRLVYDGLMDCISKSYPHLLPMLDGDGRHGQSGVPLEEDLWGEVLADK